MDRYEVEVTAMGIGEVRKFEFDEFVDTVRFFWSGGCEHTTIEAKLQQMKKILSEMNEHGDALETVYGGLLIKLIYFRWPEFDRKMKRVNG